MKKNCYKCGRDYEKKEMARVDDFNRSGWLCTACYDYFIKCTKCNRFKNFVGHGGACRECCDKYNLPLTLPRKNPPKLIFTDIAQRYAEMG